MQSVAPPLSEVPIMVINTDDAPDRLVAVWADAERLGLRIERVGQSASGNASRDRLQAHADAWARIANGACEFAIVADDDVGLDERLLPLLNVDVLAREFDGPTVVNLDGGPSAAPEPTRIVYAARPPHSFGAYIVDRATATLLQQLATGAESLDGLLLNLSRHGVETLVAAPPPVAGGTVEPLEGTRTGWFSRALRRLRGAEAVAAKRVNRATVPDLPAAGIAERGA